LGQPVTQQLVGGATAAGSRTGAASPLAGRVAVVVPVLNGMKYLPRTTPTLLAAARRTGNVTVNYVDNGSTDGTLDYLESLVTEGVRIHRFQGSSIGGMRNYGARAAGEEYLSFIDADCTIPEAYFDDALSVLRTTGAVATGCETHAPDAPHWIEATWHALHYIGRDRDVHYLNSANFFISRAAFESVGGFREDLRTGEDAEIGQRIVNAGLRIRECTRVEAVHFGNPKSVREFYRRTVWHGLGMFGTVNRRRLDKPTIMMAAHLVATLIGVAALFVGPWAWPWRVAAFVALQLLAPAVTVAHRIRQTRKVPRIDSALILYWFYYWARLQAFAIVAVGRSERYMK
jgi:glycosyltransferase involved in cell wall biosynthesis